MKKQSQTNLMHCLRFRKRQALAYKAGQSLTQRVVPSFDVSRFTGILATSSMLFIRNDLVIGFPEIRIAMTCLISFRNCFPQLATSLRTAVADDVSHDLACRTAQRDPDPTFVDALADERPQLIQLQGGCGRVACIRFQQRLAQGRERQLFFLSQSLTVLRATPKVRVTPRKELRS